MDENAIRILVENWWIIFLVLLIIVVAIITIIVIILRKQTITTIKIGGLNITFEADAAKPPKTTPAVPETPAKPLDGTSAIKPVYEHSEAFAACFDDLAKNAKRITLVGIGLVILHSNPRLVKLVEHINKNGCKLEVFLANPFSPMLEKRMIEEQLGRSLNVVGSRDKGLKPDLSRTGLVEFMAQLLYLRSREISDKKNFTLKVFSHYPTMSLCIIDDEYFFYPYGYALLGTFSPVTHYSKKNPAHKAMIDFLDQQYERVNAHSVDAELVYDIHNTKGQLIDNIRNKRLRIEDDDRLIPFAVYIIPNINTPLYKFGSETIGYDIRNGEHLLSPWKDFVGAAEFFGFHMTVADSLYFCHEAEIDLLSQEIEYLAREFKPFDVELSLETEFPNKQGVALKCTDKSGSLEALHHEMVARVYRLATASNYSLGLAAFDRDKETNRANLMVQRYRAPYILQQFKPHFSLLSAAPSENKETMLSLADEIRQKMVKLGMQLPLTVTIDGLALLKRPRQEKYWKIHSDEIKF